MSKHLLYYCAAQLLLVLCWIVVGHGLDAVEDGSFASWGLAQPFAFFYLPGVGSAFAVWLLALSANRVDSPR